MSTTLRDPLTLRLAQLYALRSLLDGIILDCEREMQSAQVDGSCPKCGAPEEKQRDASTMGTGKRTKCLVCLEER